MNRSDPAATGSSGAPYVQGDVIAVRGLSHRYGPLLALDGVEFSVPAGEIFGVLGPNGAGKTTLLEIIEGLITPTAGTAIVLGYDVRAEPVRVKERIGVQLQASSYQQELTLRELLVLFGSFYPRAADPDALLARVGLGERAGALLRQLSGGMRQRFSIVAALVNEPQVVFLDEPTAGLDPDARHALWAIVREVRAAGATVVLTTHYMEEAEALCDRVAILEGGRIAGIDAPARLVRSLAAPYRIAATVSAPIARAAFAAIEGLDELELTPNAEGERVTLRARHGAHATEQLVALAHAAGATILDLRVEPATLEDVFLALTGRALSERQA